MQLIARFRITLAYLLLVAFSLIALPRELWHHCEHQSLNIQNADAKQAQITVTQELCSICAVQITPFISSTSWESHFEVLGFHLQVLSHYVGQEFKLSTSISLRGPPLG